MIIRAAQAGDAEQLAPLHLLVWDEAYTGLIPQPILDERRARPLEARIERWRGRIAWPQGSTWVADDDGELVGFVSTGPGRDGSGELELMSLYIRRSHYGTGLGHRLLTTAIGDGAAYLWVLDGNARAIEFYRRHGFALDGQTETEVEGLHHRMVRGPRRD